MLSIKRAEELKFGDVLYKIDYSFLEPPKIEEVTVVTVSTLIKSRYSPEFDRKEIFLKFDDLKEYQLHPYKVGSVVEKACCGYNVRFCLNFFLFAPEEKQEAEEVLKEVIEGYKKCIKKKYEDSLKL